MDETKVQIGEEVLLDTRTIHSRYSADGFKLFGITERLNGLQLEKRMKNIVKCPNCGEDVEEFRLIEINTGRRTQRFCPKCYGYGSKQADARNAEVKLKLFLQY